jgi:crotonobetainyl-CoA:carnitine CoA-transferase CaiB-like acyl-CoA transferase
VIQAMSGIMDSIQIDGVPQKTGVSFADVLGGAFALTGTLAALVAREQTGAGNAIDISMQDAAAWITQWHPALAAGAMPPRVIACSDGYVAAALPSSVQSPADARTITRAALIARLTNEGHAAAPVQTITEVAQCAQTTSRELLRRVPDSAGQVRPVFASPIRLSTTPAVARRAIGPLGEANAAIWPDMKE